MDLIETCTYGLISEASQCPSEKFEDIARLEWDCYKAIPYWFHTPPMSGKKRLSNCSLQVNDKKYEFLEPIMAERPTITMDYIKGNLKTMSATFIASFSDAKISGGLRIIDDTSQTTKMSTFELTLENVKVHFLAGLEIVVNSFSITNIIHKLEFKLSLNVLKEESVQKKTWISAFRDIADDIRNPLESYLAEHFLKTTINNMKCTLKFLVMFQRTVVNDFIGPNRSKRDLFRFHKERIVYVFDQFISLLMFLANTQRPQKNNVTFVLPDIVVPNSTKQNGALQLSGGSLRCCNVSAQPKATVEWVEEGLIILFAYVKFEEFTIKYDKYIDDTGDFRKEIPNLSIPFKYQGHVTLSVRKNEVNQIDIKVLEFKIPELRFQMNPGDIDSCELCQSNDVFTEQEEEDDEEEEQEEKQKKKEKEKEKQRISNINPRIIPWIDYILGVVAVPLIEDHFKNAITAVVKNEMLIPVAICPVHHDTMLDDLFETEPFDIFYYDDEEDYA